MCGRKQFLEKDVCEVPGLVWEVLAISVCVFLIVFEIFSTIDHRLELINSSVLRQTFSVAGRNGGTNEYIGRQKRKTMSRAYASSVLKAVVALICNTIGWDAANPLAMEQLISVTEHFLREITRQMVRGSELCNRSESNLDDLAFAFRMCGINLEEMQAYTANVQPVPLPYVVGRFPLPHASNRGGPIAPPEIASKEEEKKK